MGFFSRTRSVVLSVVTAAGVSAAAFLGLSGDKGAPMTAAYEGLVLANYTDIVGVETWCVGETQVGRLESGYTEQYCMMIFKQQFNQYSARLYGCYSDEMKKYVTPSMHAAFVDVYYNTGAKCRTSMMRSLKAGKPVEACDSILKYKYAGGRDCSIRSNNCYGVWDRRVKMHDICVKEAKQLEAKNANGSN